MIVALVLVSAFLHAAWNALLRVEPDKDRGLVAAVTVATLFATAVAGVRWLVTGTAPFAGAEALAWSLLAGVLEWLYFWSLAKALDRGQLGPIYTISRGGAILVVYPLSIVLYHEVVAVAAAIGSAVVFAGIALSSARTGDNRTTHRSALAWAIACAVSIAGYHLSYKAALHSGASPSASFAISLALASAMNFVRTRGVWVYARDRLARVALMGLVCGGSFLILMEALSGGGAGFVLTLRNTSVLFATALAFAIGERPQRPQIIGAALVAAGAALMASA